jgi:hypothetical protein
MKKTSRCAGVFALYLSFGNQLATLASCRLPDPEQQAARDAGKSVLGNIGNGEYITYISHRYKNAWKYVEV